MLTTVSFGSGIGHIFFQFVRVNTDRRQPEAVKGEHKSDPFHTGQARGHPHQSPHLPQTAAAGEGELVVSSAQPLIGVILQENGRELVRYFADEDAADAAIPQVATQAALDAIGAWSDLNWEEMEAALDRIRHESPPTPPIEL